MSVLITGYLERVNTQGEKFYVFIVSGKPEVIKSSNGSHYMVSRRATLPAASMNEEMCKAMIGEKIPGRIERQSSDEYDYTLPNGEVIKLKHSYRYSDEKTVEETVFN